MVYMLCRNRVEDYAKWHAVFVSHKDAHEAAGLRLIELWRDLDEPNNVFFMFEVEDIQKAKDFVSNPAAAEAGRVSGVIDGDIHYVKSA